MRLTCLVKPNAKQSKLVKTAENKYSLWVNVPPKENKANKVCIEILSEYFKLPKKNIVLLHGERSKNKIFEILEYK